MDADGLSSADLVWACATSAEERVARRLGLNAVRVGVCVANGVPEGRLVSFGLAGSLGELRIGDALVHDPAERARLREASGADAVDMESGVLARSGRLAGVVRAISDDAGSAVEGVDKTVHADGRTNIAGLLRWVATRRGGAIRSMRDALRALQALEQAVAT